MSSDSGVSLIEVLGRRDLITTLKKTLHKIGAIVTM